MQPGLTDEREVHPLAVALGGVAWFQCLLILQVVTPRQDRLWSVLHTEKLDLLTLIKTRFWSDDGSLGHIALALNLIAIVWLSLPLVVALPSLRAKQKLPLHLYEAVHWIGFLGMLAWLASFGALMEYFNVLLFLPVFFALVVAFAAMWLLGTGHKIKDIMPVVRVVWAFRIYRLRATVQGAMDSQTGAIDRKLPS